MVDDRKMFKKCDLRDQIKRTPIVVDDDVLAIGEALWNFDCIVCVCVLLFKIQDVFFFSRLSCNGAQNVQQVAVTIDTMKKPKSIYAIEVFALQKLKEKTEDFYSISTIHWDARSIARNQRGWRKTESKHGTKSNEQTL